MKGTRTAMNNPTTAYGPFLTDTLGRKMESQSKRNGYGLRTPLTKRKREKIATTMTASIPSASVQNINRKSQELSDAGIALLNQYEVDLASCVGKVAIRGTPVIKHSLNYSITGMYPDVNYVVYVDSNSAVLYNGECFWVLSGNKDKLYFDNLWIVVDDEVMRRAGEQLPEAYFEVQAKLNNIESQKVNLNSAIKKEIDIREHSTLFVNDKRNPEKITVLKNALDYIALEKEVAIRYGQLSAKEISNPNIADVLTQQESITLTESSNIRK